MSDGSTSRKRTFQDVADHHNLVDPSTAEVGTTSTNNIAMNLLDINKLSLEAIFHPKFENENRELQSIRAEMKDKVTTQAGYLEVSLKHSGNLLLWSGGQRYFSKNSTGNAFTFVGELLLRQHFQRVWYPEYTTGEAMYKECSDYVEKHRLTLAFEAVTSVLGHHGELPKKDFLILTAIAQKAKQQFCTTVEILELAQRFRLPHNDVWVFSTPESVDKLFHLYDTTRETGLADDTVAALNTSANAHVSSMYPHVDFQGDILEGIVIRYVAYKDGEREQQENQLKILEQGALDVLQQVPVDRPMCFDLVGSSQSAISSLNVRKVFFDCIASGGYVDLTARLGDAISNVLHQTDAHRRSITKELNSDWNIPRLAKSILEKTDIDEETKRIAELIVKIDQQNAAVRYGIFLEDGQRLISTIHVIHDRTFMKFQRDMQRGDMHLYRGFSIELGAGVSQGSVTTARSSQEAESVQSDGDGDARLMLKMKFLPYMVRTFCCRNGLKTLEKAGIEGFTAYTWKQMTSWSISERAMAKWQPFFRAWGTYAAEYLNGADRDYIDKSLPPIGEAFYLTHLEHFVPLYENGVFANNENGCISKTEYHGMVVVVAINKETADQVAAYVAQELGGVRLYDDIKQVLDALKDSSGSGGVVGTVVEKGPGRLRNSKEHCSNTSIILFDCDTESITKSKDGNDVKKWLGLVQRWEKIHGAAVKHVASVADQVSEATMECIDSDAVLRFQPSSELEQVLADLKHRSHEASIVDKRQGLLIFFPCIPGCGKSTLSDGQSQEVLNNFLKSHDTDNELQLPQRKLTTLVGDTVPKKYWDVVKKLRIKQPASVLIADKNAPRSSWSTVGNAAGNGLVVPVLPDKRALVTTRINGLRRPSGEFDAQISHFYPFSLHYLAVCMARVMARPTKSHIGGLDCSVKQACLVLIKFFGLYRHVSSEDFMELLVSMVERSGSTCSRTPIILPFFEANELPVLPEDLSQALTEALQLRYGYELERKDVEALVSTDPVVEAMESRLREVIVKHQAMLFGLTATVEASRAAFVDQITLQIKSLSPKEVLTPISDNEMAVKPHITLVSIDVSVENLHEELKSVAKGEPTVMEILCSMDINNAVFGKRGGFEQLPHVTLAHTSRMSQEEMRSKFDFLIGKTVSLLVTGMLWNNRIAALSVEVPETSDDGVPIPKSTNSFVHITLWRKGAQAVESNNLPALVTKGEAKQVVFSVPFKINGTLSYWTT